MKKINVVYTSLLSFGVFSVLFGWYISEFVAIRISKNFQPVTDYSSLKLGLLVLIGCIVLAFTLLYRLRIGYWLTIITSVLISILTVFSFIYHLSTTLSYAHVAFVKSEILLALLQTSVTVVTSVLLLMMLLSNEVKLEFKK